MFIRSTLSSGDVQAELDKPSNSQIGKAHRATATATPHLKERFKTGWL
jgi:hypothetical protein